MDTPSQLCGSMTPAEYMRQRVEQYIGWYDKKAVGTKSKYLRMRAITVVGGAVVPVLINIHVPYLSIATTVISLLVVTLVSLESVFHYREQWKNYRSTEQYLSREKVLFLTAEGPYKKLTKDQTFILFVERVESAIESENASTLSVMTVASQPKPHVGSSKPQHEET